MKQEEIIKNINEQFKNLRKQYNNLLEDFAPREIHDFRLQIKKLRAFIRLSSEDAQDKIKIPLKVKSFYTITGLIRNLQLHEQRINNLCDSFCINKPKSYLNFLKQEQENYKKRAREESINISLSKFQNKIINALPKKLKNVSIQNFLFRKSKELAELVLYAQYEEALHELRKLLKDIQYNWKIIAPYMQSIFLSFLTDPANIKIATDKLGDFHDLFVSQSFLDPEKLDIVFPGNEKKILEIFSRYLEQKKEEMKREIETVFYDMKQEEYTQEIF